MIVSRVVAAALSDLCPITRLVGVARSLGGVQGWRTSCPAPRGRCVAQRALLHRRITVSGQAGLMRRRPARVPAPRSGFAGFRFPPEVIMVAVRWYLRYGLSYREVEAVVGDGGM